MISAKVIADSKNEFGNRITTMIVTMPRIILAEFNTHRMFSRNSASSRAIPFEKMVKSVEKNPFIPIAWQKDHKGMQGMEYFTDNIEINLKRTHWLTASRMALAQAKQLASESTTKQLCNRLLEPFMWHTVIVTATEWENFFALRCPQYTTITGKIYRSKKDYCKDLGVKDEGTEPFFWFNLNKGQAEIHMMALAEAMWDAYNESTPKELKAGEWHIPYEDKINSMFSLDQFMISVKYHRPVSLEVSTMMAARTSYTVFGDDGKEWTLDKYREKHDELVNANPLHASPMEHCAKAMNHEEFHIYRNGKLDIDILVDKGLSAGWSGNFRGFIQYRKMFNNENITK